MPIATVNIALPDNLTNATLVSKLGDSNVDKHQFANNLINLLQALASGAQSGAISYQTSPTSVVTQLTVDFTFDNAGFVDGDGFNIGVLEFSCSAGAPAQQNQFQVGASSALTAQSFLDLLNGEFYQSVAGGFISGARVNNVVTITCKQLGMNLIQITSENSAFALPSSDSFYPGQPPFDTSVPQVCAILSYGQATEAP